MRETGGRAGALELAAAALARRDLSAAALEERLLRAGADPGAARAAVNRLAALGAIDDARLATVRASRLAARGYSNSAIEERLGAEGLARPELEAALARLEPESARARRVAAGAPGRSPRELAAALSRRGFPAEVLEAVLSPLDGGGDAELG
ncbi:MAG: RecX family transcriptional regulator [Thermoleophilia bacterium]|nr:RecX family transcriptional regulator [Thermoleophilia bacterium]